MNRNWRDEYRSKTVPLAQALESIRSGDRIFLGSACGLPQALLRGLLENAGRISDAELLHVLALGALPYAHPRYAASFRPHAFYLGGGLNEAFAAGRADYTPTFLFQVPELFRSRHLEIDVALIQVSPPDEHGYVSLGVSVDVTRAAAERAALVIAQINPQMPRTGGESFLHLDRLHYLVEHDEPLLEWRPEHRLEPSVVHRIAEHVARLVPDGATLQVGLGALPDAILDHLKGKNDLGVHSGAIGDGIARLARAGQITGRRKSLDAGKLVAAFAAGSRELFQFLNHNPRVEMRPSDYTNHPYVLAQQEGLVAINAVLEVDLAGQITADPAGHGAYAGLGGQTDFLRGAALAKQGRPILVMPSTEMTADGPRSRIVPHLQEGAGIALARGDIHYVVTEYGVAYLHGRNLRERAMALIGIAHPDFRGELLHAAKRRHLVYADQILPAGRAFDPEPYTTTITLREGTPVLVRPIRPDDESLMRDMFYSFSAQTVYLRFHHAMAAIPHTRMQVFCNVDFDTEVALVGVVNPDQAPEIVAVARYYADLGAKQAELAFAVQDAWQHKGLGTYLFRRLVDIAVQRGIRKFVAEVLTENAGMLKIFHRSGLDVQTTTEAGVVHVTLTVPDTPRPAAAK